MGDHYLHTSPLVHLDGDEFFADSAHPEIHDHEIAQALCGFAFYAGQQIGWRDRLLDRIEEAYRKNGGRA